VQDDLRETEVEILYPSDWDEVGMVPEIVIFEPRLYRQLDLVAVLIDGDNAHVKEMSTFVETRSEGGLVRSFKFLKLITPGDYAVQIVEAAMKNVVATVGLRIKLEISNIELAPALNSIEYFYTHTRSVRFISNGVGKSGTSWLYHILGSFPGIACLDMPAAGFSGTRPEELAAVPFSTVYHGHLSYSLGNVMALEALDYHNVCIYRDLRSIVVSEYFHKFHLSRGMHRPDLLDRSLDEMLSLEMIYRWSDVIYQANYALGWSRSGMCAMISYENLNQSTVKELSSLMSKWGLSCHPNLIEYIVKKNCFEKASGGRQPGETDTESFFRNGTVDDWRRYLSSETEKGIAERNPDYFRTFGYQ
jgi:hypothetical protein